MNDRVAIFDHISADNFDAAVRVDDEIEAHAELLEGFPDMGRIGRIAGTRELVIAETPYIVAYEIAADKINVWRVLHGSHQWPESL